jgi:hypothetical protein
MDRGLSRPLRDLGTQDSEPWIRDLGCHYLLQKNRSQKQVDIGLDEARDSPRPISQISNVTLGLPTLFMTCEEITQKVLECPSQHS